MVQSDVILVAERGDTLGGGLKRAASRLKLGLIRTQDAGAALELARREAPRVCAVDLLLGEPDGFALCVALKEALPGVPVVMMSHLLSDPGFVQREMERAGADGFLGRGSGEEAICALLEELLRRRVSLPSPVVDGRRCLIVEDDPSVRALCEGFARSFGLEPVSAGDSEEALRRFREARPALCLIDLLLPGGHGFRLCEQIRALPEGAQVPIVIMSGAWKDISELREEMQRHKVDDFLPKPFAREALWDVFRVHLGIEAPSPRSGASLGRLQEDVGQHMAARLGPAGRLEELDFASLLYRLYVQRSTGSLEVGQGDERRVIRVIQGRPVFVSGALDAAQTVDGLLRRGLLRPERRAEALGRGRDAQGVGDWAQVEGIARADEVEQVFDEQVRAAALGCFGLEAGPWRFAAGSRALSGPRFAQNPAALIRDAVLQRCAGNQLAAVMERLAGRYVWRSGAFALMEPLFPLRSQAEELFLAQVDGRGTVAELLQGKTLQIHQALELLWSLYQTRMIFFEETPEVAEVAPMHSSASFGAESVSQSYRSEPKLEGLPEVLERRSLWARIFER
jgi:DNA-binding response OmpR family regulator